MTIVDAGFSAPWVDLSDLPSDVDPYALAIPMASLNEHQWLQIRRTGIGSSDAGTVLGENPFETPFALFMKKTGQWEPDDLSDNEAIEVGNDLEEYCGRKLAERTRRKVRRDNFMRRSAEYPFMGCNVDFDVVAEDGGKPEIAECKTSLGRAALSDLWGDGPTDVPPSYLLQVMHQMIVKSRTRAYIPALLAGPRFKIYTVDYDPDLAKIIIRAEREFFQRMLDNNPPPVTSLDDAKRAWPKSVPDKPCQASDEIMDISNQLRAAKASKNADEQLVKTLEGQLAGFMQDADCLMYRDRKVLTYKSQSRKEFVMPASTFRVVRFAGEDRA